MNTLIEFSSNENIQILWDVLLDELNISINNKNLVSNIKIIFESNIKPFISRANPQKPLINLNKDFLTQVYLAINKLIPNLKQIKNQEYKQISITNEEINEPYIIEEIHNTRLNNFEKEMKKKQQEFDNIVNPPKPKEIDFTIKEKDSKITEMEKLIAETMAKRKFDIEQITYSVNDSSVSLSNNIVENNSNKKNTEEKKVTWNDNIVSYEDKNNYIDNQNIYNENIDNNIINNNIDNNNIFSKLKTKSISNNELANREIENINTIISNLNNEIINIKSSIQTLNNNIFQILTILQEQEKK
jgi:hypothetical protein